MISRQLPSLTKPTNLENRYMSHPDITNWDYYAYVEAFLLIPYQNVFLLNTHPLLKT